MYKVLLFAVLSILLSSTSKRPSQQISQDHLFVSQIINPKKGNIHFFLKDEQEQIFGNFQNLKEYLIRNNIELKFAMNAGMYQKDGTPLGYYVEKGKVIREKNIAQKAYGNFYMQPNGVFYILKNGTAIILPTEKHIEPKEIEYATQSGPMLLVEGKMNEHFRNGSLNLHIRNAVGLLPDGNLLFAMSKEKINFYDLSLFFLNKGCKNALYLDGFVSRTFLPEKDWVQTDGNFGAIITELKNHKH